MLQRLKLCGLMVWDRPLSEVNTHSSRLVMGAATRPHLANRLCDTLSISTVVAKRTSGIYGPLVKPNRPQSLTMSLHCWHTPPVNALAECLAVDAIFSLSWRSANWEALGTDIMGLCSPTCKSRCIIWQTSLLCSLPSPPSWLLPRIVGKGPPPPICTMAPLLSQLSS